MINTARLFDFPYYQLEKKNLTDCLVTKYNGVWVKTSTQEYIDKANAISRALLRLGVKKNDKIAVISSTNRTEWHIVDIGANHGTWTRETLKYFPDAFYTLIEPQKWLQPSFQDLLDSNSKIKSKRKTK